LLAHHGTSTEEEELEIENEEIEPEPRAATDIEALRQELEQLHERVKSTDAPRHCPGDPDVEEDD
jgi:hypothetical protein